MSAFPFPSASPTGSLSQLYPGIPLLLHLYTTARVHTTATCLLHTDHKAVSLTFAASAPSPRAQSDDACRVTGLCCLKLSNISLRRSLVPLQPRCARSELHLPLVSSLPPALLPNFFSPSFQPKLCRHSRFCLAWGLCVCRCSHYT